MKYMWRQRNDISVDTNPQSASEKLFRKQFSEAMDYRLEHMALKKGKRFRSAFTTEQVNYLEKEFRKFPYIGNNHRKEVANALNIPERAVKIWFQNRRMKEKKDAATKDPEFDDRNNQKNAEFTNDQLNNVRLMPTVNEPTSNGLPLLTKCKDSSNKNNNEKSNEIDEACFPEPKINFYKELSSNHASFPVTNATHVNSPSIAMNNTVPTLPHTASAEFSIDLCKKYKNDFVSIHEHLKKPIQSPKLENVMAQPLELIKQDPLKEEFKYSPESVPQDLSYNKCNNRPLSESPPKNISPNNLGFQPVYVANYAPPYVSPANMLWKPVNVMPVMSTGASAVTISSNLAGSLSVAQNQSTLKKPCTCDCHMKTPDTVNFAENNQSPHAQYIITAVPFQNYPKF